MAAKNNPPETQASAEEHIDLQAAAMEESAEDQEENAVVEEADANLTGSPSVQSFDLYINPKTPALGLYVRTGGSLPGFANPRQWIFDRTVAEDELSADIVQGIKATGHTFQRLD